MTDSNSGEGSARKPGARLDSYQLWCPAMVSRAIAGVAAIMLLSGCPDPNTYGTPRTLGPGDLQLQASTPVYGFTENGKTQFTAGFPSVGARLGLADRLDMGARLVGFFGLGSDLKYNFLRGRIDMAVDPMVQGFYMPPAQYSASTTLTTGIAIIQAQVPLLVGFNIDEATTVVVTPGFIATLATASPEENGGSPSQIAFATTGAGARLGVGLNVHTSETFSWQPELAAWHEFNGVESTVYLLGIGVSLGAQPDYSDLAPRY